MIPSIARQSIIFKCSMQSSVMVGNYELYYGAGLVKKLFGGNFTKEMPPEELSEALQQQIEAYAPKDEKEKYLLKMLSVYEPLPEYDSQMKLLFHWGENETELWEVDGRYPE